MTSEIKPSVLRQIRWSILGAVTLVGIDGVVSGSFMISILVCPIWFLVALIAAIFRKKSRILAVKIAIPILTFVALYGNASLQSAVARENAKMIIEACSNYLKVTGVYPKALEDLIPYQLDSVPRAKYALSLGEFKYWEHDGRHWLMWVDIPPFGRPYYVLEEAKWGYLD